MPVNFGFLVLATVFPVPPLQQLGVMLRFRSEVDGATEYVENAPVHVVAHLPAEFGIEGFRIAAS
jgi:hypothetical protein